MSDVRILHQFAFSPFATKARFALARKGLATRIKNYIPMLQLGVLRVSKQRKVPVLEDAGQVIVDSTEILRHLEATYPQPALVPDDAEAATRAWQLEDWADEVVGEAVRALSLLVVRDAPRLASALPTGFAWLEPAAPLLAPVLTRALMLNYGLQKRSRLAAEGDLVAALDHVSRHLDAGALDSQRPTVAEDTVAALLTPVLALEGHLGRADGHAALGWARAHVAAIPPLIEA